MKFNDPTGLVSFIAGADPSCGALIISGGLFNGQTVSGVMSGKTGVELMAQLLWHEGGMIYSEDLVNRSAALAYYRDMTAPGTAVLNQWDIDNGKLFVYDGSSRRVCPLGHSLERALAELFTTATFASDGRTDPKNVFDFGGAMKQPKRKELDDVLRRNAAASPTTLDSGIYTSIACEGVLSAVRITSELITGERARLQPNGLVLLYWNKVSSDEFAGLPGYRRWQSDRERGHAFWGLPSVPGGSSAGTARGDGLSPTPSPGGGGKWK